MSVFRCFMLRGQVYRILPVNTAELPALSSSPQVGPLSFVSSGCAAAPVIPDYPKYAWRDDGWFDISPLLLNPDNSEAKLFWKVRQK